MISEKFKSLYESMTKDDQELLYNIAVNICSSRKPEGKWVSVPEAAILYGKSNDTIYRMIKDGKLMKKKESERKTYVWIEGGLNHVSGVAL